MRTSTKLSLLSVAILIFSLNAIQAQNVYFSQHQIIGKWILKSANFNGHDVFMEDCKEEVFFEFTNDGKVRFTSLDGKKGEGIFLLKENKLIDPEVPEYSNADILELTEKKMLLEMREDRDKVLMRFEIDRMD